MTVCHASDCAIHNAPAYPAGACDCGVEPQGGKWPDPTPEMLGNSRFNAIWNAIKTWDINVPHAYGGYCGATGNHARAIFDALNARDIP